MSTSLSVKINNIGLALNAISWRIKASDKLRNGHSLGFFTDSSYVSGEKRKDHRYIFPAVTMKKTPSSRPTPEQVEKRTSQV